MDKCKQLWVSQMAAEGRPQLDIAKQAGVSTATISRLLSKEEIRSKVAYIRSLIAERAYQASADNVVSAIQDYQLPADGKDDIMRREHGFKASLRVLESMGILESRSQPAFVQNIMVAQTQNIISPVIDTALSQAINGHNGTTYSGDDDS